MYNNGTAAGAINTGVPAAFIAVTAADQWQTVAGAALVLAAMVNLLLLTRNARQRGRTFTPTA